MKYIIDFIYLLALLGYSPKIIYRMLRQDRYRCGWSQRLGKINKKAPQKKSIWIHAVSVGEVNATKTIIQALENKLEDYEIVISTTTDTGFARANKLYGQRYCVFFYPFDFSAVIKRAFANIKPAVCILMELELWPNLADYACKNNVPVVIVNGRISDRSFPKYKLIKPLVKPVFRKVSLFLAQSQEYAQRFTALGGKAEAAVITGSLKYDTAQTDSNIEGASQLAEKLNIKDKRLLVAGGTGTDEEEIIADAFKKLKTGSQFSDVVLAIVPRKPERFDAVAEMLKKHGFKITRYSKIKAEQLEKNLTPDAVILGDTMGDLRKFYANAELVFVGRSLVPMGGSDMMESTAMAKCTIFGRFTFNFKQTVQALLTGSGAIEVKDGAELAETFRKCLADKKFADTIAKNGRKIILENQGATEKSVNAIAKILTE